MGKFNKNIDWDKVLNQLDQDDKGTGLLSAEEEELKVELLKLKKETSVLLQNYKYQDSQSHWKKLKAVIDTSERNKQPIRLWSRIGITAAIFFIIAIGIYFKIFHTPSARQFVEVSSKDITPGGNKATLTLANGRKIILSDAGNGMLAQEGTADIKKDKNGMVSYHDAGTSKANMVVYNTMSTPRGGIYQLRLSDGTLAVLNSGSSITYPTSFFGKDRLVKVTGEVYFEVAHNPQMPFKVTSKKQQIEVLGTHFNVNTYEDEPATKTTLLEGSVKITNDRNQTLYLKPGEQSQNAGNLGLVANVNAETAVAWKNGFFHFENADISSIMRNFSRWYDVEVSYTGVSTGRRFTGDIYRNLTLSKALEVLSYLKIRFKIEGRKIIVIQ